MCVLAFAYLSFRQPFPPQCGLSDGPTRCCTWSKSVWQALLCSRDWRAYSWQCSLPQVQTGSEVRVPVGQKGRFLGAHSDSGNLRHLSLQREGKFKCSNVFPLFISLWILYSFNCFDFISNICFIQTTMLSPPHHYTVHLLMESSYSTLLAIRAIRKRRSWLCMCLNFIS